MDKNAAHKYAAIIARRLDTFGVMLFGFADLSDLEIVFENEISLGNETGHRAYYPRAVSFAIRMNPEIMASIRGGPTQAYVEEYKKVNTLLNKIAIALQTDITHMGYQTYAVPASERTDTVNIRGDFPHKTAATRAGLGWVGKSSMLITKQHGPWIRLGTVLTDLPLPYATPVVKSYCGTCTNCGDACPARAIANQEWYPGIPREELLDVFACDTWKKEHYFHLNRGQTCGICGVVCPFGG